MGIIHFLLVSDDLIPFCLIFFPWRCMKERVSADSNPNAQQEAIFSTFTNTGLQTKFHESAETWGKQGNGIFVEQIIIEHLLCAG